MKLGLLLLLLLETFALASERPLVEWTMINVNGTDQQADAHLLRLNDGKNYLLDAGFMNGFALQYLQAKKIKELEAVWISHPHKDHYGGLRSFVEAGIKINRVFMTRPDREVCDREIPWGCDYPHVMELMRYLAQKSIPVLALHTGDILYDHSGVKMEVLYAFDGRNTPIGVTDINDTSVISRLTVGTQKILFTGDLNHRMGLYLAQNATDLGADILKVPHHGTDSVAPNEFFDKVRAKTALVPSPKALWESARSQRVRTYFISKKTNVYVNGIDGHVRLDMGNKSTEVSAFKSPQIGPMGTKQSKVTSQNGSGH